MAGEPASLDNIFLSSTDHNYNKTLAAGKLVTLICSVLLFNDCEVGGILAPKELVSENGLVSLPYSCNVDVGSTVFWTSSEDSYQYTFNCELVAMESSSTLHSSSKPPWIGHNYNRILAGTRSATHAQRDTSNYFAEETHLDSYRRWNSLPKDPREDFLPESSPSEVFTQGHLLGIFIRGLLKTACTSGHSLITSFYSPCHT